MTSARERLTDEMLDAVATSKNNFRYNCNEDLWILYWGSRPKNDEGVDPRMYGYVAHARLLGIEVEGWDRPYD